MSRPSTPASSGQSVRDAPPTPSHGTSAPPSAFNPWPWVPPVVLLVMVVVNAILIYLAVTTEDRLVEMDPPAPTADVDAP